MLAAYTVGMMSLSLTYLLPTFTILAMITVFARVAVCSPPVPDIRLDVRVAGRLALVNFAFLFTLYMFVRLFVRWT